MIPARPTLIEDPNDPGTFLIQDMFPYGGGGSGGSPGGGDTYPPKLIWNNSGEKFFETGIDRGVLYPSGMGGIAWNGLVAVNEAPSGGEAQPYYLDGVKYLNYSSPEEYEANLEAYTYPEEFELCDGSFSLANGLTITQQNRKSFGLSYRTVVGNDIHGSDFAYKIHLLYNAMAEPSSKEYSSIADETEPLTFDWKLVTRPVKFQDDAFGVKYGSHLVLDSRKIYPEAMRAIEEVLYGTDANAARLPLPQEIIDIFADNSIFKVTDNGDGTWTATGPDDAIKMVSSTEFEITWPSVDYLDADTYIISTY